MKRYAAEWRHKWWIKTTKKTKTNIINWIRWWVLAHFNWQMLYMRLRIRATKLIVHSRNLRDALSQVSRKGHWDQSLTRLSIEFSLCCRQSFCFKNHSVVGQQATPYLLTRNTVLVKERHPCCETGTPFLWKNNTHVAKHKHCRFANDAQCTLFSQKNSQM
jgi:hypothetical protein